MLPRPHEYDNPGQWNGPTERHHPTTSTSTSTSSTSTPPLPTFSPSLPDPSTHYSFGNSQYPVMPSIANSGENSFSPGPPPPAPSTTTNTTSSYTGRANGVTMFPPSELNPLPEDRSSSSGGQWSAQDRRKSCKVTTSSSSRSMGDLVAADWSSNQLNQNQRRASWAPNSTSSFPNPFPQQFSHSPLANSHDISYLSPLSAPQHSFVNSPSNQHLPHPTSNFPHFHPSFLSSSSLSSSSQSNSPFPPSQHYPFHLPPPVGPSHDLSLPFRDFTGSSHSLASVQPHSSFPPPNYHQQQQYFGNPLQSHHHQLPAPPPVPLTAYLPSSTSTNSLRPPSPPSRTPSQTHTQSRRRSSASSLPPNPSSPYIPSSDPSKPSAAVLKAAAHRRKLGVLDITGRLSPADKSARRTVLQTSTRRAVELDYNCYQCGSEIGKLTLRGGAVDLEGGADAANYHGRFVCSTCMPLPSVTGNGKDRELAFTGYNDEAIYEDTLSGAVDRFEGLDLETNDVRPTPAPPGKSRTGFTPTQALTNGKKRRASVLDSTEGLLGCDVCRREIGSGQLSRTDGAAVNASIEVLCAFCDTRYLRCSDCGGGGGTKGVGRWRCKEMFPHGRRTCQLLHTRLNAVNDMDYDVWPISKLSEAERDKVSTICAEFHASSILGTLAVPDMIESVSAIARSFEEVEKICIDCWTTYDPLIRNDIEATSDRATKRFVALRWSTPMIRKKKSRAKAPTLNADGTPSRRGGSRPKARTSPSMSPDASNGGPVLIREGKLLSGFVIAEHELEDGILHLALTVPTGAGEAYEATTRLLQTLIARAHDELAETNAERARQNLPPYPPLTTAWTMHMTKRDSRIMSRVETRRGFIPLEEYLASHPESRRECFAPIRETYLPPELLRGWTVYVKSIEQEDFPPNRSQSQQSHQPQQETEPTYSTSTHYL
ncbi:uncharacterized protein JCM6883_002530 [Sporobolomyces salmoneus]|uniref:uncharacterized protein n=1 Tax=Sporobolomyces salmoneus TaxID=183962 RepID=UPI00316D00C0